MRPEFSLFMILGISATLLFGGCILGKVLGRRPPKSLCGRVLRGAPFWIAVYSTLAGISYLAPRAIPGIILLVLGLLSPGVLSLVFSNLEREQRNALSSQD